MTNSFPPNSAFNFLPTDVDLRSVKTARGRALPSQRTGSPGAAVRPIVDKDERKKHKSRVGFFTRTSHEFRPAALEVVGPPQAFDNNDGFGPSIAYPVKRPDAPGLGEFRLLVSKTSAFDKIDAKELAPITRLAKRLKPDDHYLQINTGNVWAVVAEPNLTPKEVKDGKQAIIAAHNGGWVRHETIGDGYIGVNYNDWYKMATGAFEKLYRPNNDPMEQVSKLWKRDLDI